MSACNFDIPFSMPTSALISKARKAIEEQGGEFIGDDLSGTFTVSFVGNSISGSYNVQAQVLQILILNKPFFVPCNAIEQLLLKKLG